MIAVGVVVVVVVAGAPLARTPACRFARVRACVLASIDRSVGRSVASARRRSRAQRPRRAFPCLGSRQPPASQRGSHHARDTHTRARDAALAGLVAWFDSVFFFLFFGLIGSTAPPGLKITVVPRDRSRPVSSSSARSKNSGSIHAKQVKIWIHAKQVVEVESDGCAQTEALPDWLLACCKVLNSGRMAGSYATHGPGGLVANRNGGMRLWL